MKDIPFERSFASHPKSKYWSSKNELKPEQVTKSNKLVIGLLQKKQKLEMILKIKWHSIIRICQRIVLNDLENWENQLKQVIKNYDKPELIKIGNIYK